MTMEIDPPTKASNKEEEEEERKISVHPVSIVEMEVLSVLHLSLTSLTLLINHVNNSACDCEHGGSVHAHYLRRLSSGRFVSRNGALVWHDW